MQYIQLHTKEDFKKVMTKYKKTHKLYMWEHYKSDTCYIPDDDFFISLDKVKKINGSSPISII